MELVPISTLSLKVGDRILYGKVSATVIAHDTKDTEVPYMVGWKEGEPLPSSIKRGQTPITTVGGSLDPRNKSYVLTIANIDLYTTNTWMLGGTRVSLLTASATTSVPGGMKCAGRNCGDPFNPYATPNQPDGITYLCFQCRGRPSWAR